MTEADWIKSHLHYDPLTGKLTRKRPWGHAYEGKELKAPNGNGYLRIAVGGRKFYAHRLAWLCMTGAWPHKQIDHINGERSDNRWENLRESNQQENSRNSRIRRNNKSGFKGVCADRTEWRANIMINGKQIYLGSFKTKEEAAASYRDASSKLFGQFAHP